MPNTSTMARSLQEGNGTQDAVKNRSPRRLDRGGSKLNGLSRAQIARMSDAELVAAIQTSQPPFLDETDLKRCEFWDRATLERVFHLTRRCYSHSSL